MKMKETTRTIKRYKSLEGQYVPRNDITDCFYMQENRSSRLQMFSEIGVLKNFAIFIGKTLVLDSLFKKVAGLCLKTRNSIKRWLHHRSFSVNIAKFLRSTFFREHLRWLLLNIETVHKGLTFDNGKY